MQDAADGGCSMPEAKSAGGSDGKELHNGRGVHCITSESICVGTPTARVEPLAVKEG